MRAVLGERYVAQERLPKKLHDFARLLGAREAGSRRARHLRAVGADQLEGPGGLRIRPRDEAAERDALEVLGPARAQGTEIDVVGLEIDVAATVVRQAL